MAANRIVKATAVCTVARAVSSWLDRPCPLSSRENSGTTVSQARDTRVKSHSGCHGPQSIAMAMHVVHAKHALRWTLVLGSGAVLTDQLRWAIRLALDCDNVFIRDNITTHAQLLAVLFDGRCDNLVCMQESVPDIAHNVFACKVFCIPDGAHPLLSLLKQQAGEGDTACLPVPSQSIDADAQ